MKMLYEGRPTEKLAAAEKLHTALEPHLKDLPRLTGELDRLRLACEALSCRMTDMNLGRLCGCCAARTGGGCCSAYMADNTDAVQILINLLMGATVALQPDSEENCCFLGPNGCIFPVKPVFCLNYNCTHILTGAIPDNLSVLYRLAAAVLTRQTRIEGLLLQIVRHKTTTAMEP
jgi:hypothetical protein